MTIQQFILKYPVYISEIEKIIKPEYLIVVDKLRSIKIKEHYLCRNLKAISEYEARGFVWALFLNEFKIQSIERDLLEFID